MRGFSDRLPPLVQRVKPVDQVAELEELEVLVHRGPRHPELPGQRVLHHDPARVHAKIDEEFLKLEDVPDVVQGHDVALQDLVHHVLAQEPLGCRRVLHEGRLGEAPLQQIAMEVGQQHGTSLHHVLRLGGQQLGEVAQHQARRQVRPGKLSKERVLVEGQGGHPDLQPAPTPDSVPLPLRTALADPVATIL